MLPVVECSPWSGVRDSPANQFSRKTSLGPPMPPVMSQGPAHLQQESRQAPQTLMLLWAFPTPGVHMLLGHKSHFSSLYLEWLFSPTQTFILKSALEFFPQRLIQYK